ncbi:MAG: KAP family NTPase [Holosporales bacterium]|jgi:uncharacterized protein YeeX (DUF496 family)|nr:KAP family NTPase [Holosporales bacterium]
MRKDEANIYSWPKKEFEEFVNGKKYWEDLSPGAREFAEQILRDIRIRELPYVLSIEGGFGTGKTHFITRFCEYVKNEGKIKAVYMSAFEYDYVANPMICITESIIREFGESSNELFIKATSIIFNICSHFSGLKLKLDDVKEFFNKKDPVQEFKEYLSKMIKENGRRLVLIVDELDRCKPDFAIRLLEVLKHCFNIDGLFVILVLNYDCFVQSLKSVYGQNFGESAKNDDKGERYIDKFVDDRLPMYVPTEEEYAKIVSDFAEKKGVPKERFNFSMSYEKYKNNLMYQIFLQNKLTMRQAGKALEFIAANSEANELFLYLVCRKIVNENRQVSRAYIEPSDNERNREYKKRVEIAGNLGNYLRENRYSKQLKDFAAEHGLYQLIYGYGENFYDNLKKQVVSYSKDIFKDNGNAAPFAEAYLSEVFEKLRAIVLPPISVQY